MIIFNWPGLIMAAMAFAAAFGIGRLTGHSAEGPLMIIAGPLCAALDLLFRWKSNDDRRLPSTKRWFSPDFGGSLFFVPLWCLGAFWLILGIVYTVQGRS